MIGQEAEELVYLFCTASRREFVQKILAGDVQADGSMPLHATPASDHAIALRGGRLHHRQHGRHHRAVVQLAGRHLLALPATNDHRPQAVHWMASLWPGPMRPSGRMLHQINQLGLALQHPALKGLLPMPPVFGQCSQALSAADDAAAASLYWSVIQQDQPLVDLDVATGVMEHAVRLNPWVGEPQMVLAQLYLSAGRRDEAAAVARSALQFRRLGQRLGQRVQWDAWVAWTRILLQGATAQDSGAWPARLDKLNNVALKPETVA